MSSCEVLAQTQSSCKSEMTQELVPDGSGGAAERRAQATPCSTALTGGGVNSLIASAKKQRSPRAMPSSPKRVKMFQEDDSSSQEGVGEAAVDEDASTLQHSFQAKLQQDMDAASNGPQQQQHLPAVGQNGVRLQHEQQLPPHHFGHHHHHPPTQGAVFSPSFHVPRTRRSSVDMQHQPHPPQDVVMEQQQQAQHGPPVDHMLSSALQPLAMEQQQQHLPPATAQAHPIDEDGAEDGSTDEQANGHAMDHTDAGCTAMQVQPQLHHGHVEAHTVVPEAVEHELQPAEAAAAEEEDLDYMDFDPLLFIKLLPPLEQVVPKHRKPLLPKKARGCKRKTLVLDLDETLVHSCLEAQADADFTFPVHFNAQEHVIHVRQRPHLHTFMNRVAELYEVVVFTASQKVYAERLLNIIDPERRLIKHRIFRESCVVVDGNYLKDLSSLGRDLAGTLIVDNSPQAFGFQVDNGVPIESWYDDPQDTELLKLLPFLEELVDAPDVRPKIADKFRMREMIDKVVC